MGLIRNFQDLARNRERQVVLEIIEAGLSSIQPNRVTPSFLSLENKVLKIKDENLSLRGNQKIRLIGFGKGSAAFSKEIESILGERLTEGYVIDSADTPSSKISFTRGTHPLPSEKNLGFTKSIKDKFEGKLSEQDLVIVVICGGGSAMLTLPATIPFEKKVEVNKALLKSGADIYEINTVRKHLSLVKGGGLAKILYPAKILTLIFSDVPGNNLSFIASGPTVLDKTTSSDAWRIIRKYKLAEDLQLEPSDLYETPKEARYFQNVKNILALSNSTALSAMEQKAVSLGYRAKIYTDRLQGEARKIQGQLLEKTPKGSILLAGGETTVKVKGNGKGGRNQEVVLGTLPYLSGNTVIASVDSDGWDNSPLAGAIADQTTLQKAQFLHLDPVSYLNRNCSLEFFKSVGDGIVTGKLPANISDLFVVFCP